MLSYARDRHCHGIEFEIFSQPACCKIHAAFSVGDSTVIEFISVCILITVNQIFINISLSLRYCIIEYWAALVTCKFLKEICNHFWNERSRNIHRSKQIHVYCKNQCKKGKKCFNRQA